VLLAALGQSPATTCGSDMTSMPCESWKASLVSSGDHEGRRATDRCRCDVLGLQPHSHHDVPAEPIFLGPSGARLGLFAERPPSLRHIALATDEPGQRLLAARLDRLAISGRLHGLALEHAVALTPPRGYTPDFVLPVPTGPLGDIADDLASLRATPAAQIRADMKLFSTQHQHGPGIAGPWLANPRREVRRLADLLEAYWARAIEPVWPRLSAFLDADIAYRARRLAGGPETLYAHLSTNVQWRQPHLDVHVPVHDAAVPLDGMGLLLVPSAFAANRPAVIDRAPWQPTLSYPARGIATLWEQAAPAPDGLVRLLGSSRAAMLADVAAPRSTTELARRLSISPATASHHLTALRDAGLVTGRRERRSVLYARTPLGDALARAPTA
jgi:DNA-binding transcriptional ArsR family regulator